MRSVTRALSFIMSFSSLAVAALSLSSASAFANAADLSFDYVIVGGGTSGLVVANRLSELPDVSVAVIEAGASVFNNSEVYATDGYGEAFGSAIDYAYESVPQIYAGNKTQILRAGKAIGGTSTINGMAVTRAQNVQIDAWEQLGNSGWNWDALFPYYKKSSEVEVPNDSQIAAGAAYDPFNYGTSPQKVGWVYEMLNGSTHSIVNETWSNAGVPYNPDVNGGDMRGFSQYPRYVDTVADVRLDTARAYYYPFQNRSNLHLFSQTHANKIVWSNSTAGDAVASGVEVTSSNGTTYVISANQEVILSAGALKSPVILEYSGVGNPA
jgi:choline dehydrogenase-like flavoprotein